MVLKIEVDDASSGGDTQLSMASDTITLEGMLYQHDGLKERLINAFGCAEMAALSAFRRKTGFWQRFSRLRARLHGGSADFGQTCRHAISLLRTRNRLPSANSMKSWARFLTSPR